MISLGHVGISFLSVLDRFLRKQSVPCQINRIIAILCFIAKKRKHEKNTKKKNFWHLWRRIINKTRVSLTRCFYWAVLENASLTWKVRKKAFWKLKNSSKIKAFWNKNKSFSWDLEKFTKKSFKLDFMESFLEISQDLNKN